MRRVAQPRLVKLTFHWTDTDTDTDTDFLARPVQLAELSADFSPTRAFSRDDVRWGCARVHVYVYCT